MSVILIDVDSQIGLRRRRYHKKNVKSSYRCQI